MEPGTGGPCEALDAVVARITEISQIRESAVSVLRVANDPAAGALELAAAIGRDPALSARIVRTVNSAAYGLRRKVSRLVEAVAMLGMKRVRNLAMAALVCDLFKSGHRFGSYDRQRLWQHLVGVGVGARAIVGAASYAEPEEAFLAGLLHDVGIILEDQFVHEGFVRVVEASAADELFAQTEQRILGFDHRQLGVRVGAMWGFPPAVMGAIAYHHQPDQYDGECTLVVSAVALADWVCGQIGITAVGLAGTTEPSAWALEQVGLQAEDLTLFADDIQAELASDDPLVSV